MKRSLCKGQSNIASPIIKKQRLQAWIDKWMFHNPLHYNLLFTVYIMPALYHFACLLINLFSCLISSQCYLKSHVAVFSLVDACHVITILSSDWSAS